MKEFILDKRIALFEQTLIIHQGILEFKYHPNITQKIKAHSRVVSALMEAKLILGIKESFGYAHGGIVYTKDNI